MGMKFNGILKGTMKISFKMNEILDFNLYCKFRSIWSCFGKNVFTGNSYAV